VDHLEEVGINFTTVFACLKASDFTFTIVAVSTEPDALFFHLEEPLF
jgi:hypothetical protein